MIFSRAAGNPACGAAVSRGIGGFFVLPTGSPSFPFGKKVLHIGWRGVIISAVTFSMKLSESAEQGKPEVENPLENS